MGGVFSQHQGGANYRKDARELINFADLYQEFAIILQEDNYNNAVEYFNSQSGREYIQKRMYDDFKDYNVLTEDGDVNTIELGVDLFYPLMYEIIVNSINVAQAFHDVYANDYGLLMQSIKICGPIIDYFYEEDELERAMWLHRNEYNVSFIFLLYAATEDNFKSVKWYLETVKPQNEEIYEVMQNVSNSEMNDLLYNYTTETAVMRGGKRRSKKKRSSKKKSSKRRSSKRKTSKRKTSKRRSSKRKSTKRKTSKKKKSPLVYNKNMTRKEFLRWMKQIDKRPKTYEKTENGSYPISWNIGSDLKENEIYTTDLNIFFHKNGESVTSSYTKPSYTLKKSEIRKIVRKIVKEEQKNRNIKKINKVATHFKPFLYRGKPEKGAMIAEISIYYS